MSYGQYEKEYKKEILDNLQNMIDEQKEKNRSNL